MSAATKRILALVLVPLALGCGSNEDPQAIRKSVNLLVAKARSGTPAESKEAEKALVRRAKGSQAAVAALIDRLAEDDAFWPVPGRRVAAEALFGCGKTAIPALAIAMREHKSPQARMQIAWILTGSCQRHEYAFESLLSCLRDEDPEVRSRAAALLANDADENMEQLAAAARDQDPRMRAGVLCALCWACWQFSLPNTDEHRLKATEATFAGALSDADTEVRRTAAYVLGQAALKLSYADGRKLAQTSVPALKKAVKEDTDPTVRYRAALAMMRILKEDKEVQFLKEYEEDYEREADRIAAAADIAPYFDYEADLKDIHLKVKTVDSEGRIDFNPYPEAFGAASRLFNNTPWKGKTREQVANLLCDPAAISGSGKPAASGQDEDLSYRLDDGRVRVVYYFHFEGRRVTRVEVHWN